MVKPRNRLKFVLSQLGEKKTAVIDNINAANNWKLSNISSSSPLCDVPYWKKKDIIKAKRHFRSEFTSEQTKDDFIVKVFLYQGNGCYRKNQQQ